MCPQSFYTMRPAATHVLLPAALLTMQDYMPEATLRHAAWMGGAVLARVSFSQVCVCPAQPVGCSWALVETRRFAARFAAC